ncbi:hypothetical protein ACTWPT_57420 [Nonomuraea sp. 3N208]|uniref:hypothetical protein n=1 Tax=Nonomuraea sp. 3N208 TaxID=3457421 RepID=UPI003FD23B8A
MRRHEGEATGADIVRSLESVAAGQVVFGASTGGRVLAAAQDAGLGTLRDRPPGRAER